MTKSSTITLPFQRFSGNLEDYDLDERDKVYIIEEGKSLVEYFAKFVSKGEFFIVKDDLCLFTKEADYWEGHEL
jgi:hypothetical protein